MVFSLFFLTGAEVGVGADTLGWGIAGRGKRPEAEPKPDFRWIQKPEKAREKAADAFSWKD